MVLGLIGRPWRPGGDLQSFTPDQFAAFDRPGYIRIAWAFAIAPSAGGCVLRTETRVAGTDGSARRRFRVYWWFVGPFSSLIRRRMLRDVRASAGLRSHRSRI